MLKDISQYLLFPFLEMEEKLTCWRVRKVDVVVECILCFYFHDQEENLLPCGSQIGAHVKCSLLLVPAS